MKKLIISTIGLIIISTSLAVAKPYCRIESVAIDGDCHIIVVGWWDDNGTPNNSEDDRRLGTDTFRRCN